jgi:uncharacterized Fe-S cluster-containing radical SAM superfamily enzyme
MVYPNTVYTVHYVSTNCLCSNKHLMYRLYISLYITLHRCLQPADVPKIEQLNMRLSEDGTNICQNAQENVCNMTCITGTLNVSFHKDNYIVVAYFKTFYRQLHLVSL